MDSKIKAIVVDDELEAREGLKLLLEQDESVTIVAICKNGIEAIEALTNFRIDLMFLDIQMPLVDGFEVVRSIPEGRMPSIIFTTAYDQYAVKAFEVHAIDYLLKPFSDERFQQSLVRAKDLIRGQRHEDERKRMKSMAENMHFDDKEVVILDSSEKLVVKEAGKVHFIELIGIIWIEAFDYYVKIHVKDKFYTVRESMKRMLERLPEEVFIRIHKSSIINRHFISCVKTGSGGDFEIELLSGDKLKVSRSYRDAVRELISDRK